MAEQPQPSAQPPSQTADAPSKQDSAQPEATPPAQTSDQALTQEPVAEQKSAETPPVAPTEEENKNAENPSQQPPPAPISEKDQKEDEEQKAEAEQPKSPQAEPQKSEKLEKVEDQIARAESTKVQGNKLEEVKEESLIDRQTTVGQMVDGPKMPDDVHPQNSGVITSGEATPQFDKDILVRGNTEALFDKAEKQVTKNLEAEKKMALHMNAIQENAEREETTYRQTSQPVTPAQEAKHTTFSAEMDGAVVVQESLTKIPEKQPPTTKHIMIVNADSIELPDDIEIASINKDLYLRLVQINVINENENAEGQSAADIRAMKETTYPLTPGQTISYLNGQLFGRYLAVLKKHMKHAYNQIWSVKVSVIKTLKPGITEDIIDGNWTILQQELDKMSITIPDEQLEKLRKKDKTQVDALFNRIERYGKIITDSSFLKFEHIHEGDKYGDHLEDSTVYQQEYTDENISELISLRQNTFRSNASKPTILNKMITRQITKLSSNNMLIKNPRGNIVEKSFTQMMDNGLKVRNQRSDILNISTESPDQKHFIKVNQDFNSDDQPTPLQKDSSVVSLRPTENLETEHDLINSKEGPIGLSKFSPRAAAKLEPLTPASPLIPKKKKIVKDGVDILNLDAKKKASDCDSSLELILVTLSEAFTMSPKQAAALLTNNNQFLITACVKGVKGGRYDPLLDWYNLLIAECGTLSELLQLEMEQLPDSSKQTFVKVMTAVGCGFFSYCSELVFMTFSLFTQLFESFTASSEQALEQALKWFLSHSPMLDSEKAPDTTVASLLSEEKSITNTLDYVNAGGLKLSLYAISKHKEATRHAMTMYNVLCQATEQLYIIYSSEIQSHTKSTLDYLELVGEFLPIMAEMWPEKACDSGLIDFWLDLCSREAENDFKVQNKEKVLAISLLAEIWILFTDYVDDREEVTDTLIFVFKRTVSERTKSIRLLSIAYLFKILEGLINKKKKAALTLFRALIYSLVESPFDPTIREMYFVNFAEMFKANPKIPIEWLAEPLLKQIQAQLGVTWVLKIFDLTFMAEMVKHPKFKAEHAILMFDIFSQVSQEDTSYCSAAHIILLETISRFMAETPQDSELVERIKEHARQLFEQLMDLEPITRLAALNQLKRQQRQNTLKLRQGMSSIGSRSTSGLSLLGTPVSGKPPLKAQLLLGSSKPPQTNSLVNLNGSLKGNNFQKDMLRRHKKSLAITYLLKLQGLNIETINDTFLREALFDRIKEFKGLYSYFNKGHLELLKYYGDVEAMVEEYELDPQLVEQKRLEAQLSNENAYGLANKRSSIGQNPRSNQKSVASLNNRTSSKTSDRRGVVSSDTREVAIYGGDKSDQEELSRQVVPYQESQSRQRASKSVAKARAIQEIERIKKQKKDRVAQQEEEREKLRVASEKRKRRAKAEIEKKKQAFGIADKPGTQLVPDNQQEGRFGTSFKTKQVVFVNIAEEEERDRDTVLEFMKKYQKLWRNIFSKYQNTGHKANTFKQPSFEQIKNKIAELTFAEIMKLLKDHSVYPRLINKEELSQMVRLVNHRTEEQRTDIQSLSYQGYQTFLIQLAAHCFSRPPQDLSSQPLIKQVQALLATFEEATKNRKQSTLLYEDPDAVVAMTQKDRDLLKQINEKIQEEPDYPIPDGFLKVKEKVPIYNYSVPEAAVPFIGEPKTICVELVDELLSKLFDIHVLEPTVTMEERFRVKPSMQRSGIQQRAKDRTAGRAEALSIIRRAEERMAENGGIERNSRNTNRSNLPKIGVKSKNELSTADLPLVYHKVIKKQPKAKQAIYEETAFILENMIRKVCGETELQAHADDSSVPGTVHSSDSNRLSLPQSRSKERNLVKLFPQSADEGADGLTYIDRKAQLDKEKAKERRAKEKQRLDRQRKIKEELSRLKEEKKIKEEEDEVRRVEESKKKKELDKKNEERRKKRLEDQKTEALAKQDEDQAVDLDAQQAEAEAEKAAERRKAREKREFFRKQQAKLNNQFKTMSEQRKAQTLQEKQAAVKKQQYRENLKRQVDQQMKTGHSEKQVEADLVKFMEQQEVKDIFERREGSFKKYFEFYSKQGRFEISHDVEFRRNHLDFTSLNKLAIQSKIVPVLITSEQLKSIFKNTVKQEQLNLQAAQLSQLNKSAAADGGEQSGLDSLRNPSEIAASGNYIDRETFKKALVRIATQAQELLGGQSEEQKQRKAEVDEKRKQAELRKKELMKNRAEQRARLETETLAEMRTEFTQKQRQIQNAMSKSPSKKLDSVKSEGELQTNADAAQTQIVEEDFQRWLKQQDTFGNGLSSRVTEKMNKNKPRQAPAQAPINTDLIESPAPKESPAKMPPSQEAAVDGGASQEEDENPGASPLQRAKQSQAQQAAAEEELQISIISGDTLKALLEFMHIEEGADQEKKMDQVLFALSSTEGRRGQAVGHPAKRGVSKERPAAQQQQP